jgi:pimeloyl-ACP methyl ester carboxylesterase
MTQQGTLQPMLPGPRGHALAYARTPGAAPGVVFLGGFMSDMTGTKATFLEAHCRARGQGFLRFDYAGHGASEGAFTDGTIGRWADDAIAVLDALTDGPQVLVGSSMGGWVMLEVALARPARVAALVGIAAAPDFTEELIWNTLTDAQKAALEHDGFLSAPSQYGGTYRYTIGLIADGRERLRLRGEIRIHCPVRLLHGQRDPDVPWQTSLRLAEHLAATDVQVTLLKDGDHRLSRPQDLSLLTTTLDSLLPQDRGQPLPVAPVIEGTP